MEDVEKKGDYFFFPPLFQSMANEAFRTRFQVFKVDALRSQDDRFFHYVGNARKPWLKKSEYCRMLRELGREEATKYDKVRWTDPNKDSGKAIASLELQRRWGMEVCDDLYYTHIILC